MSRSRLELEECLQASCLQGGKEEFKDSGEGYSLNNLLREWKDGLGDALNHFAGLKSAWAKYCDHHDHVTCCTHEVWSV